MPIEMQRTKCHRKRQKKREENNETPGPTCNTKAENENIAFLPAALRSSHRTQFIRFRSKR